MSSKLYVRGILTDHVWKFGAVSMLTLGKGSSFPSAVLEGGHVGPSLTTTA
jgi:hypothetical protein